MLGIPKFTIVSGSIPNSIGSDITLYTSPTSATVDTGKIWVIKLWVERASGEWFDAECGGFKSLWTRFHVFSRGTSIKTYFTGVPVSSSTRNFRLQIFEFPQ